MPPPYTGDPAAQSLESLTNGMTGSCLCKSITLTLTQRDLFTKPNGHICHCYNCRQTSGSALGLTLLALPSRNVTICDPGSVMRTYEDRETTSGNVVGRSFCGQCGCSVGSFGEVLSLVCLGLFVRVPEVEFECFAGHKQTWLGRLAGKEGLQAEFVEGVGDVIERMLAERGAVKDGEKGGK